MKINKTTILAVLGSLIAVFAFFAIVGVNNASACATNDCVYPPLTGSCTTDIKRGVEGDVVTWTSQGVGGNGYYSFKWTGTDGLTSNYPTIGKRYTTAGTKTGTVEITSNYQTITRTCTVVIEKKEVEQNLSVACVANPSNVNVGQTVQYSANVSGGNGSYQYSWTGTEGLSSSSRTASKAYNTSGSKSATVTVQSGNQSRSATCSSNVNEDQQDNLQVSCVASPSNVMIGNSVRYTANVSGGNGAYSYSWSGTNGLTSSSRTATKTYSSTGSKSATVIVDSGNQTRSATCYATVEREDDNNDNSNLDGYCTGRPSSSDVDERVVWTVYPEGGNGDYQYDWSGTDSLSGSNSSITKYYSNSGTKTARVRIYSNGRSTTKTCSVNVDNNNNENNSNNLTAYCRAQPYNNQAGGRIDWTVYPQGGNGSYRYAWSGDENLQGYNSTVSKYYSNAGQKQAQVLVRSSSGDSVSVQCSALITNNTVAYNPPQDGGIYLSSIPATGISPTMKVSLFVAGLFMWSAFLAYLYIARKNEKMKEAAVLESIGQ